MAIDIRCSECDTSISDSEDIYCESCKSHYHSCGNCKDEIDPAEHSYCDYCYTTLRDEKDDAESQCSTLEERLDNVKSDSEAQLDDLQVELDEATDKLDSIMSFLEEHFPDALMAYSMLNEEMVTQNDKGD